jgi:tRNA-dihydrouridine synthase A
MIVADAVIHGDRERLLGFSGAEHPVALQLGGSDPRKLAAAALIAADYGYDEINLNVGCPSDRVRSGTFGACLMRTPALVGECVAAIRASVRVPVTVKCRLGVDEQDTKAALDALAEAVVAAGASAIWVHARKAWLQGLSPRENREVPPLDHARVHRLKARRADVFIGINGGLHSLAEARDQLASVDGAMLGRAAYHNPEMLLAVDRLFYDESRPALDARDVVESMIPYVEDAIRKGVRLAQIARHMLGLFHGCPGARRWRQILSLEGNDPNAGTEVLKSALRSLERPFASTGEAVAA